MPSEIFAGDRLADFEWTEARLWPQFQTLLAIDPDALALIDGEDRRWTRGQLSDLAESLISTLRASGVGRGRRVLFPASRDAFALAAALAVSAIEGVCCPYSTTVTEADFARLARVMGHAAHVGHSRADGWSVDLQPPDTWSADPRDGDAALIAFTSGSTGAPRAVIHGGEALNYVTRACATIARLTEGEAILGAIPLDGAAGFTFTIHMSLSLGLPLVLIDRWEAATILERAARFGCVWTTLVPTQMFTLVEAARGEDWAARLNLRVIAVGGSAMTPQLIEEAEARLGVTPLRMFGMSECLAHCSNQLEFPSDVRLTTDGRPFPGAEVEAFDDDNERLPRGHRGQGGVRGPSLFLGYAEGLGAGQERLTAEGFYLTGDEIVIDEQGFVRVVGRIKDQIIRGGYNIDPAEVEGLLSTHPAIAEVVIVPIPDGKLGERACAVCRFNTSHESVTLEALLDHLAEAGVYRRKWPEYLTATPGMRLLPTGKIDRRAMTAIAVAELAGRGPTG